MPVQPNSTPNREFVSLSQLAEDILRISRARLYELIERGAMPQPIYDTRSRRPIFDSELQRQAMAVRQTGVGIDGSAVIWYRREANATTEPAFAPARSRRRTSGSRPAAPYSELISSLQSLGVTNADQPSVAAAVAECFPSGIDAQQESEVLRIIFRHLRRRESA